MNEILTWLLDTVQDIDVVTRMVVAGIAIALETSVLIGLIVPGDTVVLVAATAVATPWEGVILGVVVVVGALLGESFGYWLGRWLGPRIRDSWVGKRIGQANWDRSERYLRRRGGPAIFLSRFLPVLHSLVPLTVGMSGFGYRRFLAWTIPACVLWSALYISVAATAAGTFRELSSTVSWAAYIFVAIIVAFLLFVFLGKKLLNRIERRHLADEDTTLVEAETVGSVESSDDASERDPSTGA